MAAPNVGKKSKNSRKHKSKSLIVPPLNLFSDSVDDDRKSSRSAECESSPFDLRHRFSFRSFRRGRSLSKSRLAEATTKSESSTPTLESRPINENFTDKKADNKKDRKGKQ